MVEGLCHQIGTEDVLDYGAGKCTLSNELPFVIQNYDPCVELLKDRPKPADIVVCTDVLEHIEPDQLEAVLDDLQSLTQEAIILVISTQKASKILDDGRNAHLIVENYRWWLPRLLNRWHMAQFNNFNFDEFLFIGQPLVEL